MRVLNNHLILVERAAADAPTVIYICDTDVFHQEIIRTANMSVNNRQAVSQAQFSSARILPSSKTFSSLYTSNESNIDSFLFEAKM